MRVSAKMQSKNNAIKVDESHNTTNDFQLENHSRVIILTGC